jgi:response regulator of citrate/malate metabolism
MTHVKTLIPEDNPQLAQINQEMAEIFNGMVPQVFTAMNLRTDLLQIIFQYVKKLMIEDHGLNRFTKELLAAYVSKLNTCAY